MSTTQQKAEPILASKVDEAEQIVKGNVLWAMGAGFIPVPLFDLGGIAAVQLKMLSELATLYGIKFSEHRTKSILAALIGSFGTASVAAPAVFSLVKIIPVIGQISGAVTLPIVAGASTYAVGKVFVQHFESGGTFLDFDPAKTKAYFEEQFKEGQKLASDIKQASK